MNVCLIVFGILLKRFSTLSPPPPLPPAKKKCNGLMGKKLKNLRAGVLLTFEFQFPCYFYS